MSNKEQIIDIEGLLNAIKDIIAENIVSKGHSASGNAIKSLEVKIDGDGGYVEGVFYMPYIEKGSKPKSIPYSKIHEWAKVKGIVKGDDTESRRISGAIAHSIIEKGTKAFQEGGIDVWSDEVDEFFNNNLNNYINIDKLWQI